ncbi:MAG TPA: hypothetical protein VK600_00345 [Candidatus Saccharimonadales bacterium]|nr:hypothetical protein [Candidatus Saccharimonadales bacterium]
MRLTAPLVLQVLALICFIVAAFDAAFFHIHTTIDLVALGLAFFVASGLVNNASPTKTS